MEQIGYIALVEQYPSDELDALVDLITDVLCSTQQSFRISGAQICSQTVKDRFAQLHQFHIEYVLDCMKKNTTEIRNIHAYLLTALYNAPVTMDHYYQAAVRHDAAQRQYLHGCGYLAAGP